MCDDVSPLEANHFIVAHEGGMAVVTPAGLQNPLKLCIIGWVPAPSGAMLGMKVVKCLHFWQQATVRLQTACTDGV